SVQRGKGLKPIERIFLLKDMREARHRIRRIEDTGAATGAFLQRIYVGGRVGAEEEGPLARGCRRAQRQPVLLALSHGKAIVMRPDTAHQNSVAIDDQVMRGDRCTDRAVLRAYEVDAVARRHV